MKGSFKEKIHYRMFEEQKHKSTNKRRFGFIMRDKNRMNHICSKGTTLNPGLSPYEMVFADSVSKLVGTCRQETGLSSGVIQLRCYFSSTIYERACMPLFIRKDHSCPRRNDNSITFDSRTVCTVHTLGAFFFCF